MRRLLSIITLTALLLVALASTAALAKGPIAVSIAGPGLSEPIDVDARHGGGEPGSGDSTLLWTRDGVTLRPESALPRREAVAIAASLAD